jgi:hypothetical protein
VVWPGFWAWPAGFDWREPDSIVAGVKKFQAGFRRPLAQANFSVTPSMPYPGEFAGGGSIFVGPGGELLKQLKVGGDDAGFFELVK